MEFKRIKYTLSDGIASIVLNSPKNLNALNPILVEDLIKALDICAADKDVKVVVISGEGRAFSAGGDVMDMLSGVEKDDLGSLIDAVRKVGVVALQIRNLRKPVIASVHGAAAGAGANLALVCDFRIAADNVQFIQAFVNLGLVPDMGGTFLLSRSLGVARTTELIMSGRPLRAEEALSLGLVNKVVPLDELEAATLEFAKQMRAKPAIAIGNMKALINRALFSGFDIDLDNETEYQTLCTGTDDFKEGVRAFAEKRKPNFQGK